MHIGTAAAGQKPNCNDAHAIWANEKGDVRQILYGSQGVPALGTDIVVEEWRKGKLAWRAAGTGTCSNGAVICYASFVNMLEGKDNETSAIIETIDTNGDGIQDWIILSALQQQAYYAGGLKVEWFNGFKPVEDERVSPQNQFKFFSCRKAG